VDSPLLLLLPPPLLPLPQMKNWNQLMMTTT